MLLQISMKRKILFAWALLKAAVRSADKPSLQPDMVALLQMINYFCYICIVSQSFVILFKYTYRINLANFGAVRVPINDCIPGRLCTLKHNKR